VEQVVGAVFAERYELEELTGSGGMSHVYRARDRQLGRRVAIKILVSRYASDPQHVERFRNEAQAVARLTHPNIVTVIDRGEADGHQFIVFEYVEGENLKQLLARVGPLPVGRALDLTIEIGRALAFAHAQGVVHRDVKPQNVLLGAGTPKVTDFGLARIVGMDGNTTTGTVVGTGDYIAPEQARGEAANEQSDVYSLGVVLYELLTGEVPFTGDSVMEVVMRHVSEPAPDVLRRRPDVPSRVATALDLALEKDVARRWPSMDAFVSELVACRRELPAPDTAPTMILPAVSPEERTQSWTPAPIAPGHQPGRRRRSRLPLVLLLLLLLILGGAAAGAYFVVRDRGGTETIGGKPANAATVHLAAVGAYDPPPGDGGERDDLVREATDGNPATYWETEHYTTAQFGNLKRGVGLVVDAGKPVELDSLTVTSDTPGFTAVVQAGSSEAGPFHPVSDSQTVRERATFGLHVGSPERYYVFWITSLASNPAESSSKPYSVHVSEITGS